MDNMETTDKVKEFLKETMTSVWKEGYEAGTVMTCSILYKTLLNAGLEETNILYLILKDLAATYGCQDLIGYMDNMTDKKTLS